MLVRQFTLLSMLALLAGCQSQTPDSQLAAQAEEVGAAREQTVDASAALRDAREDLAELREAVADAEQSVQAARNKLREQRKRLAAEKGTLAELATDTAQYRLLQERLLAEPQLEDAAIMSSVLDGRATIFGEVKDAEDRKRAQAIAESIPGVERVDNLIEIDPASS